jgi:HSP20 family molecular chaperone IbpA
VDQQNITAHLEDGVLTLTLNKRPESKPRRIAIQ